MMMEERKNTMYINQMGTGQLLYQSRGGSPILTITYFVVAILCFIVFFICMGVIDDYEFWLVLRYGRIIYLAPLVFAIAGLVGVVGCANLLLSKLKIYADHIEGTPFSVFRRTTIYIEKSQILSVEIDTKRSWLVLYTANGKHKMPCRDVRTAYQFLIQRSVEDVKVGMAGVSSPSNPGVNSRVAGRPVCPNCGKEIPSVAVFCPHCGSRLK